MVPVPSVPGFHTKCTNLELTQCFGLKKTNHVVITIP